MSTYSSYKIPDVQPYETSARALFAIKVAFGGIQHTMHIACEYTENTHYFNHT